MKLYLSNSTFTDLPEVTKDQTERITEWFRWAASDSVLNLKVPDTGRDVHIQKRHIVYIEIDTV